MNKPLIASIVSLTLCQALTAGNVGGLQYQRWNQIPSTDLTALLKTAAFYQKADVTSITQGAEAPQGVGDLYGARLRGYVIAPVSGTYTFWIASDDQGILKLSADETKSHAQVIAAVATFTDVRQWDKFPSQKSVAVTLEAGKHKEL